MRPPTSNKTIGQIIRELKARIGKILVFDIYIKL